MEYKFDEDVEGMKEKIKLFFSKTEEYTHLLLLILALLFIASAIAGRVFAKYPHISLIFTVHPLLTVADLIEEERIKEYPMLYALLGTIAVIFSACECLLRDREDGKRRSAFVGNAVSLFCGAFLLKVWQMNRELPNEAADILMSEEFNPFEYAVKIGAELMDMKLFFILALFFFGTVLVSLLLSDVYFVHALVALPTTVYVIYAWSAEKLTVHPELVVTLCIVNFAVRAIPAVSGRAIFKQKRKNNNIQKEN